jgi:hypothetical protein
MAPVRPFWSFNDMCQQPESGRMGALPPGKVQAVR